MQIELLYSQDTNWFSSLLCVYGRISNEVKKKREIKSAEAVWLAISLDIMASQSLKEIATIITKLINTVQAKREFN
jgi:hypothetical protein